MKEVDVGEIERAMASLDVYDDVYTSAHNQLMAALGRELELNRRSNRKQPKWFNAYLQYSVEHSRMTGEKVN